MLLESQEVLLQGTPICRGIAIGRPFFFAPIEDKVVETTIEASDIENEITRYRHAISIARNELKILQKRLQSESVMDGAAILEAHLQMMDDPLLTTHVENEIRATSKNADFVFQCMVTEYQKKFNSINDSFFRERFKDIQEISRRILNHLQENDFLSLKDLPPDAIIFAADITAFDTAETHSSYTGAFVTKEGGATSHAAIVAKAKGVPYVSSVDFAGLENLKDTVAIVDGRTGEIIINPSPETLAKYQKLRDQLRFHLLKLKQLGKLTPETFDGYRIFLSANLESIDEVDMMHQFGGSGVGLLRTESAFLSNDGFPSEKEQFAIYKKFVEKMNGLPIVIRTFDLGGDKYLRNQKTQECNPFLGCRAIRFLLREQELFRMQLRAILRASAYGDVSIMFPMVSSIDELHEAKEILKEVKKNLLMRGEPVAEHIPIGCMIEVPSAAMMTDMLAKECDFLSVGTNDLVQYSLAVDRSNNALQKLYRPSDPSVLRLIRLVVSEANQNEIPIAICGEVAADPRFTQLLLGLGVHELSVAPRYLPTIKNAIRNTSIVAASQLADKALTLASADQVEELLTREYRKNVPEDCFYNC